MAAKPEDKVFGPKTKAYILQRSKSLRRFLDLAVGAAETLENETDTDVGDGYAERKIVAGIYERLADLCKNLKNVIEYDHKDRRKDLVDLMAETAAMTPPDDDDSIPPDEEYGDPVGARKAVL